MSKNTLGIVAAIILVLSLIGGGYYFWQQSQIKPKAQNQNLSRTARTNAKTFDHEITKLKTDCPKVEICGNINQDLESYKNAFPNTDSGANRGQGQDRGQDRQNMTQEERDKADTNRKARRPYLDKFAAFCRQAHPKFNDNKKFNATGSISRNDTTKFTCRFWEN